METTNFDDWPTIQSVGAIFHRLIPGEQEVSQPVAEFQTGRTVDPSFVYFTD